MNKKRFASEEISHAYDVFGPPGGSTENVIRTRELLLKTLSCFSKPVGLDELFKKIRRELPKIQKQHPNFFLQVDGSDNPGHNGKYTIQDFFSDCERNGLVKISRKKDGVLYELVKGDNYTEIQTLQKQTDQWMKKSLESPLAKRIIK